MRDLISHLWEHVVEGRTVRGYTRFQGQIFIYRPYVMETEILQIFISVTCIENLLLSNHPFQLNQMLLAFTCMRQVQILAQMKSEHFSDLFIIITIIR